MEPNYSGWATKANLKCSDGRVIHSDFGKGLVKTRVPLLYQHNHDDVTQVLGYAELTHKDDGKGDAGVWSDLYFNQNPKAKEALEAIEHGDLDKLSIWAKDLEEQLYGTNGSMVHSGVIQEVSLVLAGQNPGAGLMNVLAHGDMDFDSNMMIVGFELEHSAVTEEKPPPATEEPPATTTEKSVQDVLDTLDPEQLAAVNQSIDDIVTEAVTQALTQEPEIEHTDLDSKKGSDMSDRNIFDQSNKGGTTTTLPQLKHDDMRSVLIGAKGNPADGIRALNDAKATGSLREFVRSEGGKELMHADTYGIENIEVLFPDAQAIMSRPSWIDRRQDWVKAFLNGTSHTPFSRVKTMYADITADEARARGYIKAHEKVEEVFPVFKRVTGPAFIYKKQKLDRQDIIDIVDFDVVAWMKAEMRGKLDEEIARAALFGDGRPVMLNGELNPDKIPEPTGTSGDGIRSIINDDDLYSTNYYVPLAVDAVGGEWNVLLDTVTESSEFYMGSGNKTAFLPYRTATRLLTIRDAFEKRVYRNLSEVAGDMDVSSIQRVPTELFPTDVLAIVLDLADYNFGTNRGGEITLFDDFDIDFNQYKYLIETYLSGALVLPYSAQVFRRVDPDENTLVESYPKPVVVNNVITVPSPVGVAYRRKDTEAIVTGGSTITLNDTTLKQVELEAEPKDGFYFTDDVDRKDTFTYRYKA